MDPESGATAFIGSNTEMALLMFAKDLGWVDYRDICNASNVILIILFSSECKSVEVCRASLRWSPPPVYEGCE